MKLLIISTMSGFSWGGSEELWYEVATSAIKKGYEVELILCSIKPLNRKIEILKNQNVIVHHIGELEIQNPGLVKRVFNRILGKRKPPVHKDRFTFLSNMNFDHLLISQGSAFDITYYPDLAKFLDGCKFPFDIVVHHFYESGFFTNQSKDLVRRIFKKSAKLFFVSERNKKVLERQLLTVFNQASIVKNPVNLQEKSLVRWPFQTVPQFAVVARLDISYKGQDILLQTLSSAKWKGRNFALNLFGKGPDESYLKESITFYGLHNKVFVKGHTSDISQIWAENHVLILPSLSEGLPLTIMEAMICGRPCLVTDTGDSALLIEDSANGWIAPVASVNSLDSTLEKAWSQREEWYRMGTEAHKTALEFIDYSPGDTLLEKMSDG